MVKVSKKVLSELIKLTHKEAPNEASAFLFKDNTMIVKAEPNSKSVGSFDDIDPVWVSDLIDKYGTPSALFHSHPCGAEPSYKDLLYMGTTIGFWGCPWLIMSNKMNLRAWTLNKKQNKTFRVIELEVVVSE